MHSKWVCRSFGSKTASGLIISTASGATFRHDWAWLVLCGTNGAGAVGSWLKFTVAHRCKYPSYPDYDAADASDVQYGAYQVRVDRWF